MFVANNMVETEESMYFYSFYNKYRSAAFENMDFSDLGLTAEDEQQIAKEMDSLFHM